MLRSGVDGFAASDGIRLGYCIDDFTDPWKEAPVLLLLHAAMGSARRYYAWVPPLSRHCRVVRMDLRGHGSSQVPPADRELTLDRLVRDVIELMDHLGCANAHIVGNSAGGYLGQQLAMNHGERVRSLMLFGSTPGLRHSQAPSWIPQIQAKGMRAFLAETIADRLPPPWRIEDAPADRRELRSRRKGQVDPGLVEWFLDEAAKNDPAYIGKFVLLMASYDWSDQLHRIQCPTLVVVPGAEPIGATANYEPFRRHVKDVEMRVYEGAPHNICDAFPDRCAGDVLDFLGRRFGPGV
jgi:pimeloyl-ACP methyl ester carboxylesterase